MISRLFSPALNEKNMRRALARRIFFSLSRWPRKNLGAGGRRAGRAFSPAGPRRPCGPPGLPRAFGPRRAPPPPPPNFSSRPSRRQHAKNQPHIKKLKGFLTIKENLFIVKILTDCAFSSFKRTTLFLSSAAARHKNPILEGRLKHETWNPALYCKRFSF